MLQAINQYYNSLDRIKRFGGTRNESSLRRSFANLLEEYCRTKNLTLVEEKKLENSNKRPDGTVKDGWRLNWGYWESKDTKDNLDEEIQKKLEIGYPDFNIIFENSETIVLIQQGVEVMRCKMEHPDFLDKILTKFISYERPEIKDFREAVEKFKEDIPDIIKALRSMISEQGRANKDFKRAKNEFWELCKESINSDITDFDIQEMLIQHILTAEIFDTVFGESHFHRENNIAKKLETVINTFFIGATRRNLLSSIDNYYKAIKAEAARIYNHHEKQNFLKVIYENFYKAYNPKGADRLGIVYTPNEIVRFMIESVDYLLERHFSKFISDKNVEILDPATGTGTFLTDLIEYIPSQYLEYKYKNEIHANEVAILPYYIANLNIEYTYQQKMGQYQPFENIVFVDTLDNLGFEYKGKQTGFFGWSDENIERINRQNDRKISVIIGNPPYNANQMNENDNNKNREYFEIDKRIKKTYIKASTAQKTKLYDMYSRFYRWASDRIDKNGIIAFITNRSYIDSRTFDGFRKIVSEEFDYIYIIDTQSDVRKNPKIAGTTHNVFGIQTGVAILFLVKVKENNNKNAMIHYFTLADEMLKRVKLDWFRDNKLKEIPFESINPDKNYNWIDIVDNDFEGLIPVANKETKFAKSKKAENAIFGLYSTGISTNRDEWIIDHDQDNLNIKMDYFSNKYNELNKNYQKFEPFIKWSRNLKQRLARNLKEPFDNKRIIEFYYRPYTKKFLYHSYIFIDELGLTKQLFSSINLCIIVCGITSSKSFHLLASDKIIDLHLTGDSQCLPLYRYDKDGKRTDNITKWGLTKFQNHYKNQKITKKDIFHYTYAVLHNPAYRKKYEINLKREFPRLPFYKDFYKWTKWGETLMDLHINYEKVKNANLKIHNAKKNFQNPKPKLKTNIEKGEIILDENTKILGIPKKAWEYKLGNRSALHWILDQYKEKKPRDKTIAEKFNTYKFADYKEKVIDLIKKICAVSVKTVEIIEKMEQQEPHKD
jgi:predicted helicase